MGLKVVDDATGTNWAIGQPSPGQRFLAYLGYSLHIRFALRTPTIPGVLWGFIRLAIYAGLASAPFWIDFFDKTDVPHPRLILYSVIMLALLLLNDGYSAFVKNSSKRGRLEDHKEAAALSHRYLISEIGKMVSPPVFDLQAAAFMSAINRTLNAILDRVKEELDTLDATYLEATLLLFSPNEQILVAARAVGDRATMVSTNRGATMAYHAAKARVDWRQVPSLAKDPVFAVEGISLAKCPYRSILLVPIVGQDGMNCSGVVTIDSSRPYEFWNKAITDRLYKQLMPFIRLLAILCEKSPEKV